MSLTEKLIGYQLKANEYTRLIDQSKKDNKQIYNRENSKKD